MIRQFVVEARKLEHGFRRISARIPYSLPSGHEDNDVPTFWLLLYSAMAFQLVDSFIYRCASSPERRKPTTGLVIRRLTRVVDGVEDTKLQIFAFVLYIYIYIYIHICSLFKSYE